MKEFLSAIWIPILLSLLFLAITLRGWQVTSSRDYQIEDKLSYEIQRLEKRLGAYKIVLEIKKSKDGDCELFPTLSEGK